jgi:type IV pilus assembly protein PilX
MSGPSARFRARRAQRGIALITAMLLLIVVTILAVSMFRGYGMQEKIAGNVREKQRALNAAVSAQQYAEWYLTTNPIPSTTACPNGPSNVVQVCNATIDFTQTAWASYIKFTAFTQNAGNGVLNNLATGTSVANNTYAQLPTFYITDLGGPAGGSQGRVYQINAIGYGATTNAVAVVESTFLVNNTTSRWTDK